MISPAEHGLYDVPATLCDICEEEDCPDDGCPDRPTFYSGSYASEYYAESTGMPVATVVPPEWIIISAVGHILIPANWGVFSGLLTQNENPDFNLVVEKGKVKQKICDDLNAFVCKHDNWITLWDLDNQNENSEKQKCAWM